MLEAFQRSAREDQARKARESEEVASKEGSKPAASEPSGKPTEPKPAGDAGVREAPTPPPALVQSARPEDIVSEDVLGVSPRGRHPRRPLSIPSWLPLALIVLLLAMAAAWGIGRLLRGGGETRAQEPNGAEDVVLKFEEDLAAAGAGDQASQNVRNGLLLEDDRRFLDPANRFTIRAIYFNEGPSGKARIDATYHHLRAAGLPVISPITQGKMLILCVGAEPALNERLKDIQSKVRALAGPPPQNEPGAFADAFAVNIDDYVERKSQDENQ